MSEAVSAQMVKELRERTGAGFMACKEALHEAGGDFEKAVDHLRKKGLKNVEKRAQKETAEGIVLSYIHPGSQVGVLLELNCETDFVARGEEFQEMARTVAMHIAWAAPSYVSREEVSPAVIERESEIYRSQIKPGQEKVADKVVSGKLEKFYAENCLLEQVDARDSGGKKSIGDLIQDLSIKVGEKIVVRHFARFEVGKK